MNYLLNIFIDIFVYICIYTGDICISYMYVLDTVCMSCVYIYAEYTYQCSWNYVCRAGWWWMSTKGVWIESYEQSHTHTSQSAKSMVVPWNRGTPGHHPFLDGIFHEINQPFWIPPFMETPYVETATSERVLHLRKSGAQQSISTLAKSRCLVLAGCQSNRLPGVFISIAHLKLGASRCRLLESAAL